MWIDDIKDNPVAQRFVEIASREQLEAAERGAFAEGLARSPVKFLARYAVKHQVALIGSVEETERLIAAHATEEALYAMCVHARGMANHKDIASFMASHGVSASRT